MGFRGSVRKRSSSPAITGRAHVSRIRQEAVELAGDQRARPRVLWRREAREVDAGWDDLHAVGLVVVVELVLLSHLLTCAGDHQRGGLDRSFFGFDPLRETIRLLAGLAFRLEPHLLDASKRVSREHKRHTEQLRELRT
jgi:hypothetical protein